MTPAEPIGEVQQELPFCECNTIHDWCPGTKHCKAGVISCIRTGAFCGGTLTDPCNGWCIG